MQFYNSKKDTRHECIVCGTNKDERKLNPDLVPTIDVYNPWGNISKNINPGALYTSKKQVSEKVAIALRKIFNLSKKEDINYALESVRSFSFKWW